MDTDPGLFMSKQAFNSAHINLPMLRTYAASDVIVLSCHNLEILS